MYPSFNPEAENKTERVDSVFLDRIRHFESRLHIRHFIEYVNRHEPCSLDIHWLDAWVLLDRLDTRSPNFSKATTEKVNLLTVAEFVNTLNYPHSESGYRRKDQALTMHVDAALRCHNENKMSQFFTELASIRSHVYETLELFYAARYRELHDAQVTFCASEMSRRRISSPVITLFTAQLICRLYACWFALAFIAQRFRWIKFGSFHLLNACIIADACSMALLGFGFGWTIVRMVLKQLSPCTKLFEFTKVLVNGTRRTTVLFAHIRLGLMVCVALSAIVLHSLEFAFAAISSAPRTASARESLTPSIPSTALVVFVLWIITACVPTFRDLLSLRPVCGTCDFRQHMHAFAMVRIEGGRGD